MARHSFSFGQSGCHLGVAEGGTGDNDHGGLLAGAADELELAAGLGEGLGSWIHQAR